MKCMYVGMFYFNTLPLFQFLSKVVYATSFADNTIMGWLLLETAATRTGTQRKWVG